jgi:hypothetical protein
LRGNAHGGFGGAGRRNGPSREHGTALRPDPYHDYPRCRRMLRRRGICPRIARRGVESSTRLGRHRWKVERSLAWLLANPRLTVRYERRADLLLGFLYFARALICLESMNQPKE